MRLRLRITCRFLLRVACIIVAGRLTDLHRRRSIAWRHRSRGLPVSTLLLPLGSWLRLMLLCRRGRILLLMVDMRVRVGCKLFGRVRVPIAVRSEVVPTRVDPVRSGPRRVLTLSILILWVACRVLRKVRVLLLVLRVGLGKLLGGDCTVSSG